MRCNCIVNTFRDKIGSIPLRRLVYRVKEIPESLFPLIWDFGTLNDKTEKSYIIQMIKQRFPVLDRDPRSDLLVRVLCCSQRFMRRQKDECSFVSLRDVERTLTVLEWLESNSEFLHHQIRFPGHHESFVVSLVLALGVSYYVRLDNRNPYVFAVTSEFWGR